MPGRGGRRSPAPAGRAPRPAPPPARRSSPTVSAAAASPAAAAAARRHCCCRRRLLCVRVRARGVPARGGSRRWRAAERRRGFVLARVGGGAAGGRVEAVGPRRRIAGRGARFRGDPQRRRGRAPAPAAGTTPAARPRSPRAAAALASRRARPWRRRWQAPHSSRSETRLATWLCMMSSIPSTTSRAVSESGCARVPPEREVRRRAPRRDGLREVLVWRRELRLEVFQRAASREAPRRQARGHPPHAPPPNPSSYPAAGACTTPARGTRRVRLVRG